MPNTANVMNSEESVDETLDEALHSAQEEINKARERLNATPVAPTTITIRDGGCGGSDGYTVGEVVTGVAIGSLILYGGIKLYESFSGRTVLGSQKDLFSGKGNGFK